MVKDPEVIVIMPCGYDLAVTRRASAAVENAPQSTSFADAFAGLPAFAALQLRPRRQSHRDSLGRLGRWDYEQGRQGRI